MSITAIQSTTPSLPGPARPGKPPAPSAPPPARDRLQLTQAIRQTSPSEFAMGAFLGGLFGGTFSLLTPAFFPEAVTRTLQPGPLLASGAIGAAAAGLVTDDLVKGALIGAGTNALLQGAIGAVTGGWQTALVQSLAGAVGGGIGGAIGAMARGRFGLPHSSPSDADILRFHAGLRRH